MNDGVARIAPGPKIYFSDVGGVSGGPSQSKDVRVLRGARDFSDAGQKFRLTHQLQIR